MPAGSVGFRDRVRHTVGSCKWDLLGPWFFSRQAAEIDVKVKLTQSRND